MPITVMILQKLLTAHNMKLITHPFDGDKRNIREFIENVDVAFEVVHPSKH